MMHKSRVRAIAVSDHERCDSIQRSLIVEYSKNNVKNDPFFLERLGAVPV